MEKEYIKQQIRESVTKVCQTLNALQAIESCLLYTSDAADDCSSVDLGGRRIIKKKFFKKNY